MMLCFGLLMAYQQAFSQAAGTPPYANLIVGSQADNAFPLNSATNNVQWIYGPGAFYQGGVSTGMPASFGRITKVYFQLGATTSSSVTYSNFTIKLGQPAALASQTTFPSAAWTTGLTTVFSQSSFTITGASSGAFIEVALPVPFNYDPTKALVFEMYVTGGTGNQVRQYSGSGNQRLWGTAVNNGTPSGGAGLVRFGFDISAGAGNDIGVAAIDSPTTFCGGPQNIVARVMNFGANQVTGFTVNWSLNGVAQTPITSTASLDTAGGAASNMTQITLASGYTFPSTPTVIKAWTSSPNSQTDTMRMNDSATVTKQPSISGSFTIDPNGTGPNNFTSFASAIAALNVAGVCGPVTFTVAPGTYTGQIIIPNIVGTSPVNTITFDGVSSANRTLSSNATGGTVVINGTRYLTFKNFTVTNVGTSTPAGIAMVGSVNKISIFKNIVILPSQSGTSAIGYGIIATGSANGAGVSGMSGDSIEIDSNFVTGGGYAITIYGSSSNNVNRGMKVRGNIVNDCNYMGGYIAYNYNPIEVTGNTFNMNGFQYGYYGLYFYYNQQNTTTTSHLISRNKIIGFGGYGIYCYYPMNITNGATTKIYANTVVSSLGGSYPGYYGIYLYNYNTACPAEVYQNTSVMQGGGTSTSYTAFYNTGSSNVQVKNNIFASYGGSTTPMYLATNPIGNSVNYNLYYNSNGPTANLLYRGMFYNPSTYLSATAGGDSSYNNAPSFVSRQPLPGNFHLTDGCNGYGTDLRAFVPNDIDGDTFSIMPTVGSDQFTGGNGDNLMVTKLITPVSPIVAGLQDLVFEVKNIGNNAVTSYNASYKHNTNPAVTVIKSNTLAVCQLDTVVFTGSDQINLGSSNAIAIYTSLPNTNADSDPTNDTLKTTLLGPLNGVYTVGGVNPDFATPSAAAAALVNGVGGPVTFDIRPGTYTGQLVIQGPIPGASSTNRVTFEGNDAASRTISGNITGAVVLMNKCNYVTIRNLTVTNTNTSSPVGIAAVGAGSSYETVGVQIIKCRVNVPVITSGTSTTGYGINFTSTANGTGVAATGADSSVIDSNIVTGGGYTIVHYGSSNAAYNRGLLIRGNVVNNSNYMGMYIAYNYSPIKFIRNKVNMQGQNYGYYGVYYYYNQSNSTSIPHEIIGNEVNGFGGYGIYCYYPMNTTGAPVKVYNNLINSNKTGGSYPGYYGFYLYQASTSYPAEVFNNTINMYSTGTSTSYSCFYNTGSTAVLVKNNIFANYAGSITPAYYATSPMTGNVEYNLYYNATNTSTGNLLYRGMFFNPTNYRTSAAGGDSSYNMAPPYMGVNDFRLTNGCLRGTNITSYFYTDILDSARQANPTIGAYEFQGTGLDIAPVAVLAPTYPIALGTQDLQVVVRNNGTTTVTSFDLSYKLNNGTAVTTTFTGTLNSCDTVSVYFTGSQQLNLVNASNTLRVYTALPNLSADQSPTNDTLDMQLSTPMNGNYIVGPVPSDYLTFNEAVNALKVRGATGEVNFMVKTGIYNEQLDLTSYPGSTAAGVSVNFKSIANHRDSVKLQFNTVPSSNQAVIKYNGAADRISFRNMTIENTGLSTSATMYVINYLGMTQFDTIENCNVIMQPYNASTNTTTSTYTVYAYQTQSNGNAFINNSITGSYYGMYMYGSSTARLDNLVIRGNSFSGYRYSPIYYMYYTRWAKVMNNIFTTTAVGGTTTQYMYFYYNDSGYVLSGNRFTGTGVTNYWYNYYSNNTVGNRGLIANNTIATNTALYYYIGNSVTANLDVYNNSFSTGSGYFYVAASGLNDVRIKNNIFFGTGSYSYYFSTAPTAAVTSDFNNIFSTASSNPIYAVSARNLNTFRSTYMQDLNSISFNPGYTSNTNLVPNAASANSWSINGRGQHYSRIETDILGNPRPTNVTMGVPDLGAYQFTPTSTPPTCTAVPATPVAGTSQAFILGLDTVAKIYWDAFAAVPTSVTARAYFGTVPPLISPAPNYMYHYVDISAPAGSYYYQADIYVKPEWLGTCGSMTDLRMAKYNSTTGWVVYGSTLSTIDTVRGIISATGLTDFSLFTGADNNAPLPVALVRFQGEKAGADVQLTWSTAMEKNASHFEVQRSLDGENFKTIAKVEAAGNSNRLNTYRSLDANIFGSGVGMVYYRLNMVDRDGSSELSKVITVSEDEEVATAELKAYPNPFSSELILENIPAGGRTITLTDLSGRTLFSTSVESGMTTQQINLPEGLKSGIYILSIEGAKHAKLKLIKN